MERTLVSNQELGPEDQLNENLAEAYSCYFNNCIEVGIDAMSYAEWIHELDQLGR